MRRTGAARRGGEAWSAVQQRVVAELDAAVKRPSTAENKLAGAARVLAAHNAAVRAALAKATELLGRRRGFDRPIYAAGIRTLVESGDRRATTALSGALASDEAGGFATLSAASLSADPQIGPALARVAACRHAHLSFASEVARLARSESSGAHLSALAPMIKESHRIALCVDLFVPLVRAPPLPIGIAPALAVLRDAERHLGRWLVLAAVAARAGDRAPVAEATERTRVGPASSRAAWCLVAWALDPKLAPPDTRPNAELIARLSDRPSSDRDMMFLFRLAESRAPSARSMLEGLVRTQPLPTEVAVRAARALAKWYGRDDMLDALRTTAADEEHEDLRGLAVAALWDVGHRDAALACSIPLLDSPILCTASWGALVQIAADEGVRDLVTETRFRRLQWGWNE